ncbi:MAG: nuclear transport factor 2 family protein [Brevundimonas sp.]
MRNPVRLSLFSMMAAFAILIAEPSLAQQAKAPLTPYQLVESQYQANARGDIDGMMAVLAPDVVWTEMAGFPYGGTYVGPQAILDNVVRHVGEDWDSYTFTLERLIDAGDTIIGIGVYAGVYRRTGKPMSARVVHIWDVRNGKVARFEQFADTLLISQAMIGPGVARTEAAAPAP